MHALALGLVATLAGMVDEGRPLPVRETRWIEENLWRAIRWGLSGEIIDLATGDVRPARGAIEELIEWVMPVAEELGYSPRWVGGQWAFARAWLQRELSAA